MKLLHIDSSALGGASVTRALTADLVAALTQGDATAEVVYRDLVAAPPDHLTPELVQVVKFRNLEDLDARQQRELALTDELVEEFLAADTVVVGAPMYNFSVPTQLKAWIDRIAQPGRTFRYTAEGPVGLAGGKRIYVVSARGGKMAGSAMETAMDHQEAFLKAVFGFFGITDVTIVRAEGIGLGPEAREAALAGARAEIARVAERLAA